MTRKSLVDETNGTRQETSPAAKPVVVMGDGMSTEGRVKPFDARLFEVRDGRRYPILEARSFYARDYDASDIAVLSDADVEQWPLDAATPGIGPGETVSVTTPNDFLGGGHYMATTAVLRKASVGANVDATTRTWNITMFSGFHGAVKLFYYDSARVCIGMSGGHTFGVDGTWIGTSDRTDYWSEYLPEDLAVRVTGIGVCHFWDPWSIEERIAKAVQLAKPLIELVKELLDLGAKVKTTS